MLIINRGKRGTVKSSHIMIQKKQHQLQCCSDY